MDGWDEFFGRRHFRTFQRGVCCQQSRHCRAVRTLLGGIAKRPRERADEETGGRDHAGIRFAVPGGGNGGLQPAHRYGGAGELCRYGTVGQACVVYDVRFWNERRVQEGVY